MSKQEISALEACDCILFFSLPLADSSFGAQASSRTTRGGFSPLAFLAKHKLSPGGSGVSYYLWVQLEHAVKSQMLS